MSTRKTLYPLLMALFCVVLVLSNTTAVRLVQLGPLVATAAIVLFPIAYVLGDVITEVYGYKKAQRVCWIGVFCNGLMVLTYVVTIALPGVIPEFDAIYAQVLGQVPRIVVASMIGLWAGQLTNAYVLSRLKVATQGRFLWLRTITSTLVGEAVDTALFAGLAFYGVVPPEVLWQMIWTCTLFKSAYETAITPVTYVVVTALKRYEGLDTFDTNISYNPFKGG